MPEYRDIEKLGRGGFGEVWLCESADDGTRLARKILTDNSPEAQERFRREVRILSKLAHPRIIKIEHTQLEELPYWYVMPHYAHSLAAIITTLPGNRTRIRKIFTAMLEGMNYAHEQGVVHRDLTPRNVLLNGDDDVAICDFGLGRDIDLGVTRATHTGDYLGTHGYVAPEQARDAKRADARSDVFSLGRVLLEMYTGVFPEGFYDFSCLPDGIAMVVDRCTKPDPARRFQNVRELMSAFSLIEVGRRRGNAKEELQDLAGQLVARRDVGRADIDRLADLIAQCEDDGMLLLEIAVPMPEPVFAALSTVSPEIAKLLTKKFCDTAVSQSWPFDYTDSIGGACNRLYRATRDPDVKGMVTAAALEVGASHNRWYVMGVAARLIAQATQTADALAVAAALEPLRHRLSAVEDKIQRSTLHPAIRALFETT